MKAIVFLPLVACTPSVPEAPSFQQDVMPILAANCVRCHGDPPIGGAPRDFRLDMFADLGDVVGAATMAELAADRVVAEEMPPRFGLGDYQRDVLVAWSKSPERGAPHPDNHAPSIGVEALAWQGKTLRVRLAVDDVDGDLVGGVLELGSSVVIGRVRSGTYELTWNATGVAAGSYALRATLDDGAAPIDVALGSLEVSP